MSEERLHELLREVAAEYNAPPETPRDAMWLEIAAAREALRRPAGPAAAPARWLRRLAGLAAMLALGFAVGRLATWEGGDAGAGALADAPVPEVAADRGAGVRPEHGPATGAPLPAAASAVGQAAPAQGDDGPVLRDGPLLVSAPGSLAQERRPRVDRGAAASAAREPARRNDDGPAGGVYGLVATQTLAQGEALLTTFRTAGHETRLDPGVGAWARELLTTTHLLLDSPASGDPLLRGLLEDLELVLVQIAQLSGSPADSVERVWIYETLKQRDMLPRLRTAVPAGPAAAGT